MREKMVFFFGERGKESKYLLGGKGANLGEMTRMGLPVPPGFTISTKVCMNFIRTKKYPKRLEKEINSNLDKLERKIGRKFGDERNPLLLSVRSGAPVSMPGMMDTILNLGLNEKTVKGIERESGDSRFVWDSYRRFIQMFGNVVLGVEHEKFEKILDKHKKGRKDTDLKPEELKRIVDEYKKLVKKETGKDFSGNPKKQLKMSIDAVFSSWGNKRARIYRKIHGIPDDVGTAVNVQAMVFGNLGWDSGTGVGFTRNPATGEKKPYGEYLMNAQGEDVVAGIRTPKPIEELKKDLPKVYNELIKVYKLLDRHYKDMQDFEFTIEKERLFVLQTRTGKRTAQAAVKIAVDLVRGRLLTKEEAIMRVDPQQLDHLLHKQLDPKAKEKAKVIAKGLPASPGAGVGIASFSADRAEELASEGKNVILVRAETSPEDIGGMSVSKGILTARGGMTCIAGDSMVLTNKGFLFAEHAFKLIEGGDNILILSHDTKSGRSKWKRIIAAGRRLSDVIEVSVSQTGRAMKNTIKITPDHKMLTFRNRNLIKKPVSSLLENNEFVTIVDKIPFVNLSKQNEKLAYLAGAIFTDGYINLKKTKGSVTFTQKETEEKAEFISTVRNYFNEVFNKDFNIIRTKTSNSYIGNRLLQGEALDMICTSMRPAVVLTHISQNIVQWILGLDEESTLNFLAGVIDGDGSLSNGRLQIYASKENVQQGIVVACLKLGIVPQVTFNRNIYNIQIVENVERLLRYTKRVKGNANGKKYGSKLFSIKQLFGDIAEDVNFMGRVKEAIKRNLLFDSKKIARDILPLCKSTEKAQVSSILNSDLRMYRVSKVADLGKAWVYNFEVDSKSEMDKNFVVFTKMYTPLLVSNSHAAVVARGMGKCCVAGCNDIAINEKKRMFRVSGVTVKEGDWITLDGGTGEVIVGKISVVDPELKGEFKTLMKWVDEFRKLGVRTNSDTPNDAKRSRDFGVEGIGLARTEHMFFEGDRIDAVREMILAEDEKGRRKALKKLLPMQMNDFVQIFREMNGLPVTIRLLDPPLHEFLPKEDDEIRELAKDMKITFEELKENVESLSEFNPMLGFRGCRLGVVYPEISEMQVEAIIRAAIKVNRNGGRALPEIEIPVLGSIEEAKVMRGTIDKVAKGLIRKSGVNVKYKVGTMIELPRACMVAGKLAKVMDFFSFGTNDLTQTVYGFSRDDAGSFIPKYIEKGVLKEDPFQVLDREGVGSLMKICVKSIRKVNPEMEIGICGEHGGEPNSVEFCHKIGLDYVSCSPFRVPIARLAAAQAKIKHG